MSEEPAAVVERVGCSECGSAHHQGSVIVWLKHKYHHLTDCHKEVVVEHPRAYLTEEDAEALISAAMCLAKRDKSIIEVNSCSGAAECPQIAVAVYVPNPDVMAKGAYRIGIMDGAPLAALDMARASAYTAFSHSSDTLAITTNDFRALTKDGMPWFGYDAGGKAMGVNVSKVDGGIPLYRNGQLVGGLGISGPDVTKLHKLALETAGECLAIPAALREKIAKLLAN